MPRVLLVEDEPAIVLAVRDELEFEGFDVHAVSDGTLALEEARKLQPDVVLLDVMLPGMNGFEICRRLRAEMAQVWIIMVTAREHEADRIRGLELGADDYVTKPFSLRELVARVRVGARRRQESKPEMPLRLGDIEIDPLGRKVSREGKTVALTSTEFDILCFLAQRPGQVITRDEFMDAIWGADVYVTHRVVDTHIASIRKKLGLDANKRVAVQNVRGIGYRLDLTTTES